MPRRKKQNEEMVHTLKDIKNSTDQANDKLQDIKNNTGQTNDKLQNIEENTKLIIKILKSPVTIILAIITIVIAIWGPIYGARDNSGDPPPNTPGNPEITKQAYELYLHSEYSKITIYQETNITATLNFDTDYVTITAHLASGKTDTLSMNRKNSEEWVLKVIFNEPGTHEVVAETVTPGGDVLQDSIKVEVIPMSIDIDQLFNFTY